MLRYFLQGGSARLGKPHAVILLCQIFLSEESLMTSFGICRLPDSLQQSLSNGIVVLPRSLQVIVFVVSIHTRSQY
jgi:hypothetical protein